jgi:hypothetical protein
MTKQRRPPVDTKGAAAYTNLLPNYLEKLRCTGDGPIFIKRGRRVLYDLDDIDAWLDSLKRRSTSDTGE